MALAAAAELGPLPRLNHRLPGHPRCLKFFDQTQLAVMIIAVSWMSGGGWVSGGGGGRWVSGLVSGGWWWWKWWRVSEWWKWWSSGGGGGGGSGGQWVTVASLASPAYNKYLHN